MAERYTTDDFLTWAQDESTTLDFNVFPTYAVIKVKDDPALIWLVRDGMPPTDDLLLTVLDAYFQENYKKSLPEAA